jgi:3-oxoacyl-[acyl-carrier-protein] synthase-3
VAHRPSRARRYSAISEVAVHAPARRQSGTEIESELRASGAGFRLPSGVLRGMFGLEERRVAPDAWPSDLAVAAGRRVLEQAGLGPGAVDLLIFAAASEDTEEPATAHVVAHKLGVTAPVFDVKNACNSVLNAVEIADALIRGGSYDTVLVATGERNSAFSRLPVRDRDDISVLLTGCTMGDLGAALLMEASDRPGILGGACFANSSAWQAATVTNPYHGPVPGPLSVRIDSRALAGAFTGMADEVIETLRTMGLKVGDLDLACVHQASAPFTAAILEALDIPNDKVVSTFAHYGNVAAASLPLQLAVAEGSGRLRPGDLVALIGLASGASGGVMLLNWRPGQRGTRAVDLTPC